MEKLKSSRVNILLIKKTKRIKQKKKRVSQETCKEFLLSKKNYFWIFESLNKKYFSKKSYLIFNFNLFISKKSNKNYNMKLKWIKVINEFWDCPMMPFSIYCIDKIFITEFEKTRIKISFLKCLNCLHVCFDLNVFKR